VRLIWISKIDLKFYYVVIKPITKNHSDKYNSQAAKRRQCFAFALLSLLFREKLGQINFTLGQ
jgi:hypothetical protein